MVENVIQGKRTGGMFPNFWMVLARIDGISCQKDKRRLVFSGELNAGREGRCLMKRLIGNVLFDLLNIIGHSFYK